ncbi:MAG: bi-domain-containing oxidoreductase [Candidatus Kapabacteria bacterium]|nr:bi-domain-containing oxidoreductase [Candidatus Kapabacteria bacterium]
MLQIVQHQRSGEILIEELPVPQCPDGFILVKNYYSLISSGTEKTSVSNSNSSLLQRARKQPEQVKLVMNLIKKEGLIPTIKKVQSKLDSFKTLGYSSSGMVVESRAEGFATGDRVACAGAGYAVHAEYVCIPKNLAVKIPESLSYNDAAFTTVGTIALQGIRQAEPRLGETVAVIGLGLIGQITVQLLKAAGCRVVGMDIDEKLFDLAKSFGCDICVSSSQSSISDVNAFTRGIGCDAVIITAGTQSNEPIEIAIKLTRKKGKVVVVGAVGMDIPRSPFYEREIDIRISCSYGPGRYDANYEERGIDYPAGLVRWSENRNMQAFVDLLCANKINMQALISHDFDIENAKEAYKIITGEQSEPYIGILIKYSEKENLRDSVFFPNKIHKTEKINIGFIGAGNFALTSLLPPLKEEKVNLIAVSTQTPANAKNIGSRFGFSYCTSNSDELISNTDINTIFCSSRHDSHAHYVISALKAGKAIFVEKPLCTDEQQLEEIKDNVEKYNGRVMVGFNRRFSPVFKEIKKFFNEVREPKNMIYRVNAGFLPKNHWIYGEGQRGRIIGEACHFIDCMCFLTDSKPIKIYAENISSSNIEASDYENTFITIKFADGSSGSIAYLSNGDSSVPKEYFEVFSARKTAIMNDFRTLDLFSGGKCIRKKFDGKKGHTEEVQATVKAIYEGKPMPIDFNIIYSVTNASFAVLESLATGAAILID